MILMYGGISLSDEVEILKHIKNKTQKNSVLTYSCNIKRQGNYDVWKCAVLLDAEIQHAYTGKS